LELCRSSDDSDLFYGNLYYGTPAVAERVQKLEEVLNNKREELELSLLEETVAALRDEVGLVKVLACFSSARFY
jgi:hypothetical protein